MKFLNKFVKAVCYVLLQLYVLLYLYVISFILTGALTTVVLSVVSLFMKKLPEAFITRYFLCNVVAAVPIWIFMFCFVTWQIHNEKKQK